MLRGYLGGDADGIFAVLFKSLCHAKGGFHLGDRIADDDVDARGAAEVIKHVVVLWREEWWVILTKLE
jgi:hypothetical protein